MFNDTFAIAGALSMISFGSNTHGYCFQCFIALLNLFPGCVIKNVVAQFITSSFDLIVIVAAFVVVSIVIIPVVVPIIVSTTIVAVVTTVTVVVAVITHDNAVFNGMKTFSIFEL